MEITIQELNEQARATGLDWPNILTQLVAAIIGASAALFVYYRSDHNTKRKEIDIKIENATNKFIYLSRLLDQSIKYFQSFKNGLDQFIKELEIDKIEFGSITVKATFDLKRIVENINQEEHYHAYLSIFNNLNIINIYNNCDIGYQLVQQIVKDLDDRKAINQERKITIAKGAERIRNILGEVINSIPVREKPVEMEEIIRESLLKHLYTFGELVKKADGDLIAMDNDFIIPLSKTVYELRKTPGYERLQDIFLLSSENHSAVQNTIRNNAQLIGALKGDSNTLGALIKELKEYTEVMIITANKLSEKSRTKYNKKIM